MKKRLKLGFISYLFCALSISQAQENFVSDAAKPWEKQVDSLLSDGRDLSKPGVIMAIINDNKLAYLKSFGAADMENKNPILKDTKFQIGTMARHFTAFAILLLEHQNKLSLKTDARQYLPQLNSLEKPVKIIDLLHQADALYDYSNLRLLLGRPGNFKLSNEDVIRLVGRQKHQNFEPGTDFVDTTTDTSMLLLAEIVSKVSDQSFASYMKEEIFDPIGMTNTVVVESQYGFLENLARPYLQVEGEFVSGDSFDNMYGASNMFSTIEDLVKWEMHMMNPKIGDQRLFKKLNSVVSLKNGKEFQAIQGRLTLGQQYHHYERDLFSTYYTGNYGGYASSMFKFPEQGYAAIVLSNNGEAYNGYYGVIASHIVLKDDYREPAVLDVNSLDVQPITREKLTELIGDYWDQRGGLYRTIALENDTLKYVRNSGRATPLFHLGNNKFQMLTGFDDKIFLQFESSGTQKKMWYQGGEGSPILFENFKFRKENDHWEEPYVGTYYCDVLQVGYDMVYTNGKLVLRNIHTPDIEFIRIKKELFNGNQWFIRSIVFDKDAQENITGFHTVMAELNGLQFRKID